MAERVCLCVVHVYRLVGGVAKNLRSLRIVLFIRLPGVPVKNEKRSFNIS